MARALRARARAASLIAVSRASRSALGAEGGARLAPVGAKCHGKGSAFPPGQADPPHFERARAAAHAVEASCVDRRHDDFMTILPCA